MKKQTVPTLEEARAIVEKAWADWVASHGLPEFEAQVHRMLDKSVEVVILEVLGFESRWGGDWEVDHCNGRSGNSIIGDYIRERAGKAVRAWFDEQLESLPKIPKGAIASAKRHYEEEFSRSVRHLLEEAAHDNARNYVARVLEDMKHGEEEERDG